MTAEPNSTRTTQAATDVETLAATVREMLAVLLYEDDDVEARGAAHAADHTLTDLAALVVSERERSDNWKALAHGYETQRDEAREALDKFYAHAHDEGIRANQAEWRAERAEKALRVASEQFDVLRRMAVNSRTAPNVFDSIRDVATWARDDTRAAMSGLADDTEERGT